MNGRDSIQSLLVRRKLTRAIADAARAQLVDYLTTLAPLLRPSLVFGDYVHGGSREAVRGAEKAFKDLQTHYAKVAAAPPFGLAPELSAPVTFAGAAFDITPVEYTHLIDSPSGARSIAVRKPLTWVLSHTGYGPARLPDLLSARTRSRDDLHQFVLSHLLLHVVVTRAEGLGRLCEALHFPLGSTTLPESGSLPLTTIGVGVATSLPSDAVILESAELTGMDAFEEVLHTDDLSSLRDPFKEQLLAIAREYVPDVS